MRKELDLYASIVHCFTFPGLPTRHEDVDIVVIRENTEGEYAGLEHEVVPGVVESLKVLHFFVLRIFHFSMLCEPVRFIIFAYLCLCEKM